MSEKYYGSDGSQINVDESGHVYGPNGFMGQINQFGDFVSANGQTSYKIDNYGNIIGSDGSTGRIMRDNRIVMDENKVESGSKSSSSNSGGIDWSKYRIHFILLGIPLIFLLGALSFGRIIFTAISKLIADKFGVFPAVIFYLAVIALIVFITVKLVRAVKNNDISVKHKVAEMSEKPKSKSLSIILAFVFGGIGAHNFYLGNYNKAISQVFVTAITLGLGAVWGIIDGINILVGKINVDAKGRTLK